MKGEINDVGDTEDNSRNKVLEWTKGYGIQCTNGEVNQHQQLSVLPPLSI